MTKGNLVEKLAKAGHLSKKAAEFAVDTTFESIGRSIKKENGSSFRDSVPSPCADEKPEREGILRRAPPFTSKQAGLLRLNRSRLLKKVYKKEYLGTKVVIGKLSAPVDKSVDKSNNSGS